MYLFIVEFSSVGMFTEGDYVKLLTDFTFIILFYFIV